jgi:transcriptional regulator with XRE-family HTH domain
MQIGFRLRDERTLRRLPVRLLADRSGVSRSYISDIERGLKNPTIDVLEALCAALGIDVGVLFGAGEERGLSDVERLLARVRQIVG